MKKHFFHFVIAAMIFALSCQNTTTQSNNSKGVALEKTKLIGDEKINSPYGTLEIQHNYLTDESSEKLFDARPKNRNS